MFVVQGKPEKGYTGNVARYHFLYFKYAMAWENCHYIHSRFDITYEE